MRRACARASYELHLAACCLLAPFAAFRSKAAILASLWYLYARADAHAQGAPPMHALAHPDQLAAILLGLAMARALAPPALVRARPRSEAGRLAQWRLDAAFAWRVLRADLGNFGLLHHRAADGFLITGKNSGTHWLKYMLSCAIAAEHGLPPPPHASGPQADTIIGHPRRACRAADRLAPGVPLIGSAHTIPSVAFSWRWRLLDHPPVVVLVRDIEQAMLSNYVKWRDRYQVDLAGYVRGDPRGRRFVADLWWYMHFFNRWGDVAAARPDRVLIVRYEDLQADPARWLRRVADHLGVRLGAAAMAAGLRYVGRGALQARLDPAFDEAIIPNPGSRSAVGYAPADRQVMARLTARYLRHALHRAPPLPVPATLAPEPRRIVAHARLAA